MQQHGAFLLATHSVTLGMAIVKILSRHSPSYALLIRYVLRYVANERKSNDNLIYTQNLRSDSVDGYVKEFIENEGFRRNVRTDQIHLFHEIVSFGAEENREAITPEVVDDLARQYMLLRGETGVMLGYPHWDKNHVHLHFCVSALQYRKGKSFGLNKAQLRELKLSFQEYHRQRYPELTRSFPSHGKGERYLHPSQWHKLKREEIVTEVRQCYALAASQQDFLARLRDADLHHYERDGRATGIEYGGQKFRFSRLLESRQFGDLPLDRSEEKRALAEIRSVRERDGWSRDMEGREL